MTTTPKAAIKDRDEVVAGIFADLALAPRWVGWNNEQKRDSDDLTKMPKMPGSGRNASSTDPATWGTLEEAQYLRDERGLSGVGIVLRDGLGGVDLDACRDPKTGELTEWAQEIITTFDSYTEVSPSGSGVKIFASGAPDKIPASTIPMEGASINGKAPQIEVYVTGRYFTVTGELLDTAPDEIRDAGEVGGAWDQLVHRLQELRAKNGSAPSAGGSVTHGGRNNYLTSLAGTMRKRGMEPEEIYSALSTVNERRHNPPLPDDEVRGIADGMMRYTPGADAPTQARVRCMADVEPEEVTWLWSARIPRAKLSEIVGDPGVGKSTLTTEIVGYVTTGRPLPGDGFASSCAPINVLLLSAEDGAGDTIRPRLDRAGADVSRVHIFDGIETPAGDVAPFDLRDPLHRRHLDKLIETLGVGLLIIDPLNAYMGGVDTHRDSEVRGVLAPLATIAESSGCAILAVRHLNKGSTTRAVYRAGGSIGFTAAVRSSMLVGRMDEESDEGAIVVIKANLAAFPSPVGFSLAGGRFKWTGTLDVAASDLLRPDTDSDERSDRQDTAEWLLGVLKRGPVPSVDIFKKAEDELSVSKPTVKRAKRSLGDRVIAFRESDGNEGAGRWVWELSARGSHPIDPLARTEIDPLATTVVPQGFSTSEGAQNPQGAQDNRREPLADSDAIEAAELFEDL